MIRYGFHTDEMMVCLILNGDKIPAEKAVSYTHLDVYKRQVLSCVVFNVP